MSWLLAFQYNLWFIVIGAVLLCLQLCLSEPQTEGRREMEIEIEIKIDMSAEKRNAYFWHCVFPSWSKSCRLSFKKHVLSIPTNTSGEHMHGMQVQNIYKHKASYLCPHNFHPGTIDPVCSFYWSTGLSLWNHVKKTC